MALTVGSLFSGIGGLDLGLERAGMTVKWQSEIDPYASRVLAKHWPNVPNLGDITRVDWSSVPRVDLICGGYPCQPFSYAGRRGGQDDPRHLWPRFADALRHLRPEWALLENVPGHLSMGFGNVLSDLADLGYNTEWDCIPAAAVGAPHLRYRVFVVAHADEHQHEGGASPLGRATASDVLADTESEPLRAGLRPHEPRGFGRGRLGNLGRTEHVADTPQSKRRTPQPQGMETTRRPTTELGERVGGSGPGNDWWTTEPDVGRVAHGVPARVDRLRTLGNAVVPQVAEWVGRRIMEAAA